MYWQRLDEKQIVNVHSGKVRGKQRRVDQRIVVFEVKFLCGLEFIYCTEIEPCKLSCLRPILKNIEQILSHIYFFAPEVLANKHFSDDTQAVFDIDERNGANN